MKTLQDHILTSINDLITQLAERPDSPDAKYQIVAILENMTALLASIIEREE